jgi:hypothetical protein
MIERERFKSIWNGVATIIFIGGIFLGFDVLGYSAFFFAIFLWAISGAVVDIIYGPKKSSKEASTLEGKESIDRICESCGSKLDPQSNFCMECGTSTETPAK